MVAFVQETDSVMDMKNNYVCCPGVTLCACWTAFFSAAFSTDLTEENVSSSFSHRNRRCRFLM